MSYNSNAYWVASGHQLDRIIKLEQVVQNTKERVAMLEAKVERTLPPPTGRPVFHSQPRTLDDVKVEVTANQMLDFEQTEEALEDAQALLERWLELPVLTHLNPHGLTSMRELIEDTEEHLGAYQ